MGIARTKKSATLGEPLAPDQAGVTGIPAQPIDTTGALAFSGSPYQTPWGSASASIKVRDGRVVAVSMPQVPPSPPSVYAEPYLVEQALRAGGANIQGVSGATYTSLAFKSSLEGALAQAKAQGQSIVGGTITGVTTTAKPVVPRKYRDDDDEDERDD